jgi:outer membrane protein assembly factor BamB
VESGPSIPEVPSPVAFRDRVYVVRNGGILSCFDAATGKQIFRARVGAPGPYYASPVLADGKLFVASGDGVVVVLSPGDELEILATNDIGEPIFASPAVSRGVIYVRTAWRCTRSDRSRGRRDYRPRNLRASASSARPGASAFLAISSSCV